MDFNNDGHLIFNNVFEPDEYLPLKKRAVQIANEFDLTKNSSIFTTQDNTIRDQYFFDSKNKVHCFMEEDALDKSGNWVNRQSESINKIGHGLHLHEPAFKKFNNNPKLKELAKKLELGEDPEIVQSMFIFKNPNIGGPVLPHQDQTFLYSYPRSIMGIWIAIEDATVDNGCLWAIPKGHKYPLNSRYIKSQNKTEMIDNDNKVWNEKDFIPLELKAGSVLLFHGHLPHKSYKNTSKKSRMSYVLHLKEKNSVYSKCNWNYQESFQTL